MFTVDDMTKAGCTSRRGVRFWEDQGLLGTVERSGGNQRRYTAEQLRSARIIAAAQFAGWSLTEIKAMLSDYSDDVREAILSKLAGVARTAATLGKHLPSPEADQEYDL